MTEGLLTASYIGASILFILSLGGLSSQEKAQRGNVFGIIGMAVAVLITTLSSKSPAPKDNYDEVIAMMSQQYGELGKLIAKAIQQQETK